MPRFFSVARFFRLWLCFFRQLGPHGTACFHFIARAFFFWLKSTKSLSTPCGKGLGFFFKRRDTASDAALRRRKEEGYEQGLGIWPLAFQRAFPGWPWCVWGGSPRKRRTRQWIANAYARPPERPHAVLRMQGLRLPPHHLFFSGSLIRLRISEQLGSQVRKLFVHQQRYPSDPLPR